jgi:hypothetical protein
VNVSMSMGMESAVQNLLNEAQADMDERLDALTVELRAEWSPAGTPQPVASSLRVKPLVAVRRRDRTAGSRVGFGRVAYDCSRRP